MFPWYGSARLCVYIDKIYKWEWWKEGGIGKTRAVLGNVLSRCYWWRGWRQSLLSRFGPQVFRDIPYRDHVSREGGFVLLSCGDGATSLYFSLPSSFFIFFYFLNFLPFSLGLFHHLPLGFWVWVWVHYSPPKLLLFHFLSSFFFNILFS